MRSRISTTRNLDATCHMICEIKHDGQYTPRRVAELGTSHISSYYIRECILYFRVSEGYTTGCALGLRSNYECLGNMRS